MQDKLSAPKLGSVRLKGLLGSRVDACRNNRIAVHDEDYLLWPYEEGLPVTPWESTARRYYEEVAPFRAPLGEQKWLYPLGMSSHPELTVSDWQGEFLGNWVATASLMGSDAGDQALLEKVDRVVTRWLPTQQPDGYMGTYSEAERWMSWDVWIQAHVMVGLLAHYDVSGQSRDLEAARRVADRLLVDFGPGKAFLPVGHHHGLDSSSVLEPMVLLYRRTGDQRYLDWARWLVDVDWESEEGPKTVSALTSGAGVRAVGNAKALEMIITLVGLIELYRETGEKRYFDAVEAAWTDVVERQLYITGSASVGEYFGDAILPNDGSEDIGETCVTMAWITFCLHLHRLTGDAKYLEPAERTIYNHLLAAQSDDGRGWAYYVGLRDYKRYREHTDPECCPSRGSRAMSLLPGAAIAVSGARVFLDLYDRLSADIEVEGAGSVHIDVDTDYPFAGAVKVQLGLAQTGRFELCLRKPQWCREWSLSVNGTGRDIAVDSQGYLRLAEEWKSQDRIELTLSMEPQVVSDSLGNAGHVALVRGPLVFAADKGLLPSGRLLEDVAVEIAPGVNTVHTAGDQQRSDRLEVRTARLAASEEFAFGDNSRYRLLTSARSEEGGVVTLVPFFEAGNSQPDSYRPGVWSNREHFRRATFRVWLPVVSA